MTSRGLLVLALVAVAVGFQPLLQAADIAGKWQFVLQTDNGPREIAADLTVEGSAVGGTFDTAPVTGTWKDGTLDLSFPFYSVEGNITATVTIRGRLDAAALTGTWTFGEYGGPFKATRRN